MLIGGFSTTISHYSSVLLQNVNFTRTISLHLAIAHPFFPLKHFLYLSPRLYLSISAQGYQILFYKFDIPDFRELGESFNNIVAYLPDYVN